jgi:hypothetical protein
LAGEENSYCPKASTTSFRILGFISSESMLQTNKHTGRWGEWPRLIDFVWNDSGDEGPVQFDRGGYAADGSIGPSARKMRGPQDDKTTATRKKARPKPCPKRKSVQIRMIRDEEVSP